MHVLDHIFCLPKRNGLRLSLQAMGYSRIHEVIGMTMASIKALSCKVKVDGSTVLCGPALGEVELLTALQGFAYFKAQVLGHPLPPGYWC